MRHLFSCLLVSSLLCSGSVFAQTKPAAEDAAVEARVNALLAKLTTAQKIEMLGGHDGFYVHAEPSIGLPALRMADGPVGVRNVGASTAYPAGIALAATFDTDLAFAEGAALGRDAHARGVSFLLGPGVNLYRAPMNGRNFEYFGEDPFLASRIAVGYIEGVQKQGVSATVKHFALNNEEYDRHHLDAVVDERTLRELYLPAFEAAVKEANVGAMMNSYNLINGTHASQNSYLNNRIAKQDWGFSGLIMSDWNSVYDGVAAANGGLDLEMPSAKFMNAATLNPALASGAVTQATIDDKIRRILRVAVRMNWIDHPQPVLSSKDTSLKDDPASRAVAHKAALESITLLKNEKDFLPLDAAKVCTLAVIGPNADKAIVGGGGSAQVTPIAAMSLVEALHAALPKHGNCEGVVYARGLPTNEEIFHSTKFTHGVAEQLFTSAEPTGTPDSTHTRDRLEPAAEPTKTPSANKSGRWIADYTPQSSGAVLFFVALGTQDSVQLAVNGKQVLSILKPEGHPVVSATVDGVAGQSLHLELTAHLNKNAEGIGLGLRSAATLVSEDAKAIAAKADAVVIAAGYDPHTEGEGFDRSFQLPGGQNELIHEIAVRNAHTIVAVDAGGGFDMPWLASVPALLHLWYPGEEGAPALAEILFGKANPEGHLPISLERAVADNPAHDSYYPGEGSTPEHPVIKLNEGVFLGYRYYAGAEVKPLFPFGFGLSYTQFTFSHLHADNTPQGVVVTLDVKNMGTRAGGDAVQVYVGDPSATVKRPVEELKAFSKVHLESKEATHLEFILDRRAFAWWNGATHKWQVDPGKFTIMAGDSSDHLPLRAEIEIAASAPAASAEPQSVTAPAAASGEANTAPAYKGAKEYSLSIDVTKIDYSTKEHKWTQPFTEKTRVMEQLSGFVPKIVATDKWGGRLDITQPATGFFYTKKVGDRWWAIDPEGHAYFHQALVDLAPNGGPNGKAALQRLYGDKATWMTKTHELMMKIGFNGAGAWSDADSIRHSSLQSSHPIAYTVNLDVMSNYGKHRGGLHADVGHAGYLGDVIFAFDPEFATFADSYIKGKVAQYAGDPALYGYFSDNEMPVRRSNLDHYLDLPKNEAGYLAAREWMKQHNASSPNDDLRKEFLYYEIDLYASIISAALKKYDPHHMYIGCRFTGDAEKAPEAMAALGKYADAISVNYYNSWTPDLAFMKTWEEASHKPIMITEWYVKGVDSGMPNHTGAGWLVKTQAERGDFYQNYALALIESKIVVGWHWFKYQDNDVNDPNAEASNKDANKGIVNIQFQVYGPLVERMRQLNPNAYALADYFDARPKP